MAFDGAAFDGSFQSDPISPFAFDSDAFDDAGFFTSEVGAITGDSVAVAAPATVTATATALKTLISSTQVRAPAARVSASGAKVLANVKTGQASVASPAATVQATGIKTVKAQVDAVVAAAMVQAIGGKGARPQIGSKFVSFGKTPIVLTPKDPSEKVVVGFDFSLILEFDETLSSIDSVLVTVTGGFDENKDSLLDGQPAIDETNTAVVQSVTGGLDNTQYHLTALAVTNQGRRLAVPAVLPVYIK